MFSSVLTFFYFVLCVLPLPENTPLFQIPSKCNHYMEIRVANNGASKLTNVDVNFKVPLANIMSTGKLSSCDEEFHLVEAGVYNAYYIPFWMENECNSNFDSINLWFEVGAIEPLESKYYLLYYNCENQLPGERNPQIDGMQGGGFIKMSTSTCSNVWSVYFPIVGKLLRINANYDVYYSPQDTFHLHNAQGGTTGSSSGAGVRGCDCNQEGQFVSFPHTHQFDPFESDPEMNWPYHVPLLFCRSVQNDPRGLLGDIYLFQGENLPSGVEILPSEMRENAYIKGSSTSGGDVDGAREHTHHFFTYADAASGQFLNELEADKEVAHADHGHEFFGESTPGVIEPPFYSFVLGECIADEIDLANFVYYLAETVPKFGYERVDVANGRFVTSGASVGVSGGSFLHQHFTPNNLQSEPADHEEWKNGDNVDPKTSWMDHTHILPQTELLEIELEFPYVELLLLRRVGMSSADVEVDEGVEQPLIERWWCGDFLNSDSGVCGGSGRGECLRTGACKCTYPFVWDQVTFSCIAPEDAECEIDCGDHSTCIPLATSSFCICNDGYIGNPPTIPCSKHSTTSDDNDDDNDDGGDQDKNNKKGGGVASSSGLLFAVALPMGALIVCLVGCVVIIGALFLWFFISGLQSKKDMSKLKLAIPDLDIIMQEHEIAEDTKTKVAKLEIDKSLFNIEMDSLQFKEKLGEGAGAVVFRCVWKGISVAFKFFTLNGKDDHRIETFENECKIIASVSHPSITQFYGAGLVTMYCENGNLKEFLKNHNKRTKRFYPMKEKLRIMKEIILGMVHLHSLNVVHRDLKLENIVITKTEEAKIMDFGLSRSISNATGGDEKTMRIGTGQYMAPELVLQGPTQDYSNKVDVFSFAIMMYMVFGNCYQPYGENVYGIEIRVAKQDLRPSISTLKSQKVPQWIINCILRCWDRDPMVRYSFKMLAEKFAKF